MKKVIALVLVAAFAVILFAGCGASDPTGKYSVKTIAGKALDQYFKDSFKDEKADLTTEELLNILGIKSFDDFMTLELTSDGNASITTIDDDTASTGTWKQSGDKVIITADGSSQEFKQNGNELSIELDGEKYVFVKK